MSTPTCSSPRCGAPLRWGLTTSGKRIPLNPVPDPAGNVIFERVGVDIRARILTGPDMPAQVEAWMPHWNTCPDAPEYRRRRDQALERERARRDRCPACGERLDPWLATQGFDRHICCLPPITDAEAIAEARAQIERTTR